MGWNQGFWDELRYSERDHRHHSCAVSHGLVAPARPYSSHSYSTQLHTELQMHPTVQTTPSTSAWPRDEISLDWRSARACARAVRSRTCSCFAIHTRRVLAC